MNKSNYPPGVTGREDHLTADPPDALFCLPMSRKEGWAVLRALESAINGQPIDPDESKYVTWAQNRLARIVTGNPLATVVGPTAAVADQQLGEPERQTLSQLLDEQESTYRQWLTLRMTTEAEKTVAQMKIAAIRSIRNKMFPVPF